MPKSTIKQPELQVIPEPTLEQRTRRTYTAEYRLNIISQADACTYDELGAVLGCPYPVFPLNTIL